MDEIQKPQEPQPIQPQGGGYAQEALSQPSPIQALQPVTTSSTPAAQFTTSTDAYTFNKSAFDATQKSKSPWLKITAAVLAGLALLTIFAVAALFLLGMYLLPRTDYNNGEGETFSLKFYRDPETITAEDMTPFVEGNQLKGASWLVATNQGDYPVAISITKRKSGESIYDSEVCNEPIMTVTRKGVVGGVCGFGNSSETQPMYFYEFTQAGESYLVLITQNYDREVAQRSQEMALETIRNVDLRKYNNDLQTILQSIELK